MTVEIIQTCNKCGLRRTLPGRGTLDHERNLSGWRVLDGKDICTDDIKKIFE